MHTTSKAIIPTCICDAWATFFKQSGYLCLHSLSFSTLEVRVLVMQLEVERNRMLEDWEAKVTLMEQAAEDARLAHAAEREAAEDAASLAAKAAEGEIGVNNLTRIPSATCINMGCQYRGVKALGTIKLACHVEIAVLT